MIHHLLQKNAAKDQGKEKGGGGGRKKREYVPQKRSGGYAVLLALYRQSQVHLSPPNIAGIFKLSFALWPHIIVSLSL